MTRFLLVHPGASWAVSDVHTGLFAALREEGHELLRYNLDGRIESAGGWLHHQWRRQGRQGPRPNEADVQYLASFELPYRARRTGADWVLIVSAMYLHPDALAMCRLAGIRTAAVFTESPYDDEQQARVAALVDVCWTNECTSVDALRRTNPRCYHLPAAYDPARHRPAAVLTGDVPAHDVVFVGTGFQERIDLLSGVDWEGIDLGLYGTWNLLPSRHRLRRFVRGGVIDNGMTAALYRRAKIGLNLYRTSRAYGRRVPHAQGAESLNPRALELAACGVFQLSEYRKEVREVFGEGVPTFADSTELEALVRGYLENSQLRREMALALPARVQGHSFAERAKRLVADLERAG